MAGRRRIKRVVQWDYGELKRTGRSEWEIVGIAYPFDRRVKHKLIVSYGLTDNMGHREICLSIGGRAIVLDTQGQGSLLKLILDSEEKL